MDSLPYFDSLADRYEEQACPNSELINKRIAQKIEQGIGRGVRGEKDYCAILIIGSELVRFMRSIATNKFFSPQTRKQIDIGIEIADMAKEDKTESPIKVVLSLIKQMLVRDECKSEVSGTRQEITKHEAGQMNNHCAWFEDQYGPNANVDRFMIISTKTLSYEGDFTHKVKITIG